MNITTLLADPAAIRLECIRPELRSITLIVKTTSPQALCPRCAKASTRLHSRYIRTVADLPWHGVAARLQLHTRRFFCSTIDCPQRIFCERLPAVVARYARRTVRLSDALQLIGFALGGEAGARAAIKLGMSVSPDTLLRRIRQAALPTYPLPRVLGVDDWAFCRGQRYGTILVDLERHCRIDLLPDRQAETLCTWLSAHPSIEIISRDRAPA